MKFHVLASGSKGNAALIEGPAGALLIDCGLSKKSLWEQAASVGCDLRRLKAVLITHEHGDHVGGLGVCMRGLSALGLDVAIHASAKTLMTPAFYQTGVAGNTVAFEPGQSLTLAGISVSCFATSHDTVAPQGFRFAACGRVLAYLTDSGVVSESAAEHLMAADVVALETNHDANMLACGPYPAFLKRRIASSRGHLNNDQAAHALDALLSNRLKTIICMHLSQENNCPQLARAALQCVLDRRGHAAQVAVSSQYEARSFTW
ncbi:MAG: MBL fold metallo-hydrolase [Coriobacteriales bacterium]|jgi:phosphoribosyl 1,2-cyclic phosphodiesterase|nr:MBL fold metallo-hydrolase [Coriobacteriales bacterium]